MKIKLLALLVAVFCAANMWAWPGSGTKSDPYLIASASDWNALVYNVNVSGKKYEGKYFQLTNNITVSEMIGTQANYFKGTFNGDGHTLTLNLSASEDICAPFRYISDATIKSLIVDGTITGNSYKRLAGIAGMAYGYNHISNCWVKATITSSYNDDSSIAGLVMQISETTYFTNCLFTGSFNCPNAKCIGGFVGWTYNGCTCTLTNCLFKPSSVTIGSTEGCSTFARLDGSARFNNTKAYYGNSLFVTNQGSNGTSMSDNDFLTVFGAAWEIKNDALVPVMDVPSLTGEGTMQSPHVIASATDWNNLVFNVNEMGETYSGEYFHLTADIEVSEMLGSDANRFGGIFDGDGHTLTFNKGTADSRFSEECCAPFRFINGATIKHLSIDGTIYTSSQKAAVIGLSDGTNIIQQCRSSLTINSSKSGDGTHAGFIGVLEGGNTYFTDCLFDGTFDGASTNSWGGFCGWARGDAYLTRCLFAPTSVNINTSSSATFSRNSDHVHCTNSYYKQTMGDAQGTDASSMSNDALVEALGLWQISNDKVVPMMQLQTLTGNGTVESPYLIASVVDWNELAFNVLFCDEPYSGKYFQQTSDITIVYTVGTDECPFGGIFDGDGHVLHLNIEDVRDQGTAPFRYIQNATIQYVKTDGLLAGGNYCSGLVGIAKGTNTIQGCEVAAEIYGSAGCTHSGGVLGHGKSSNTTIQDCLFSGVLEGATDTTGVIFGWGDAGEHTIINCLSSGDCAGGTVLLIAGTGTKTITNSYHSTAGPTDGTDASSMSRADLQAALGAGWGTRGSHVVPVRFAVAATPQAGVAMVDLESDYVPTQIINGNFGVCPWMSFRYNGTDITSYANSTALDNNATINASYPNGVNGGWNTTETKVFDGGLFEYTHSVNNDNIVNYGGCLEMNANSNAVLWQDLSTHANDVIRWSLLHAVRIESAPAVQSMRVEVGAPEYDGENIEAATGINEDVDSKITSVSKATYNPNGYSGTYAKGADNLTKLALSKTATGDKNAWHQVQGVYLIPEGQTVTRFAFISTNSNTVTVGNYLDNVVLSTLIGNLSAEQLPTGDVLLKGYWGETDANKQLVVEIGSTQYNFDMTSVANENFKLTIPAATIGAATTLSVYHEDYPEAKRTIETTFGFNITANEDPQNAGTYYSTFYNSSVKCELPDGVKAYVAVISGDALTMTKIADGGQVIPADNAVVLKSNIQNYTLTPSDASPVSFSEDNDLRGVDVATSVASVVASGTCYVLSGHSSDDSVTGVGFYRYSGTLKAHKAYAVIEGQNNAPNRLRFVIEGENTPTIVENVQGDKVTTKVLRDGQLIIIRNGVEYNVNGQIVK